MNWRAKTDFIKNILIFQIQVHKFSKILYYISFYTNKHIDLPLSKGGNLPMFESNSGMLELS